MHDREEIASRLPILIRGLETLDVPTLLTQQYTSGLGQTVDFVTEAFATPPPPIEKIAFSCWDEPAFLERLADLDCNRVVLGGIETHVCLLQTAIDLLEAGYTPVIAIDATSSRSPDEKRIALARLRAEGVILSTVESILFELCRTAGTDAFRAISRLVK